MAKVNNCDVCGHHVINLKRHEECDHEALLDLLHEVQEVLKDGKGSLPEDLQSKVMGVEARTLGEFKKELEKRAQRNAERELRNARRAIHLQKAGQEFDKLDPDPDSPTYSKPT